MGARPEFGLWEVAAKAEAGRGAEDKGRTAPGGRLPPRQRARDKCAQAQGLVGPHAGEDKAHEVARRLGDPHSACQPWVQSASSQDL